MRSECMPGMGRPASVASAKKRESGITPALKKPKLEVLVEACGKRLCRRGIIELRAGRKKPHRRTQQLLESILKKLGFLRSGAFSAPEQVGH